MSNVIYMIERAAGLAGQGRPLQRVVAEARKCLFDSVLAQDQRTAEIAQAILAFLELVDCPPADSHDRS